MPITDNSLYSKFIRQVENPDSMGFNNGRWYASTREKDDPNNLIDMVD